MISTIRHQLRRLRAIGILPLGICMVIFAAASVHSFAQNNLTPYFEPLVSVSANGTREVEVFRGMPLVVTAVFVHPDPFTSTAAPLLLSGGTPAWTNFVSLTVLNADGIEQTWPWQFAGGNNATVTLSETNYAEMVWWLDSAQTVSVSPGVFSLQVTLNTTNVVTPGAWKGIVEAVPVELIITNEPASLSEEQSINKFVQLALFAGRQQNPEEALNHVQTLLSRYPTNLAGLTLKASILQSMGQLEAALATTSEALVLFDQMNPLAAEMPGFLLEMLEELQESPAPGIQLSVRRSGQQLTVSWPGNTGTAYTLQHSLNLRDWSDVGATPNFEVIGSSFSWTTNVTATTQFFRVGF